MADPKPGEFEIIARYFAPLSRGHEGALGLSDDAAFLRPAPGADLVVTADALVEGVHFLPDDPPELISRKALRVNLSDLAAKGANPVAYLLTVAFPARATEDWIARFAAGLAEDGRKFGIPLIGGDTVATPGPATISITALGTVPAGRMLRRSTARAGDDVYVSGTIGDGALGLLVRKGGLAALPAAHRAALELRYRVPEPRVALGPRLVGVASAAMDVSDGLVADLGHICATSGVSAAIEEAAVPLSAAARDAVAAEEGLWARVVTGGDDYEILFCAPPGRRGRVAALAAALDLPLTRIGAIGEGKGVEVRRADGTPRVLATRGWQHF